MGTNKAFIELQGRALIDRIVEFLQGIFPEVMIVTNDPSLYLHLSVAIATDIYKDQGSLGGLYTGLFHATHDHAFVVPCDMPFLNRDFIGYMINSIGQCQIVVPEPADGLQPLHAIYGRSALPQMARFLAKGNRKIIDFYREVKTLAIPPEVIGAFDPAGRMFFNLNSPADLDRYLMM